MNNNLSSKWTLWYDKTDLNICDKNWDQYLIKIFSFHTIEDFWKLFNNICPISKIPSGSNYHFFKGDIEPKWEDSRNRLGGKWVLKIFKKNFLIIEKIWEKTLSILILENYSSLDWEEINGIVASVRKNEIRLAIWTNNALIKKKQISIGKFWKNLIQEEIDSGHFSLEYFSHNEIKQF
jgi:translation initiation factor 4E